MKNLVLLLTLFLGQNSFAIKLTDYTPFNYEVLFTNPVCKTYYYDNPIESVDGKEEYKSKPKNVYCKSHDKRASVNRDNAPEKRLVDWIRDTKTSEIFLHYLSFSNGTIAKELCEAIKKRNVKVTVVIDSNNESDPGRMAKAWQVKNCKPYRRFGNRANLPEVVTRGGDGRGSKRTGYAHNKLFFVNPNNVGEVKIAFSSGNMSSGTSTHHENWHFVTTNSKSYFAKIHKCLINGVMDHYQDIPTYKNYISECRSEINTPEEDDIKVFLIPGEGTPATNAIRNAMNKSKSVDLAAHRFSYNTLISMMSSTLKKKKTKMRLIADDDLYWSGVFRRGMGRNSTMERSRVRSLEKLGLKVKYMQTYADDIFEPKKLQLHHNKFLIFSYKNGKGGVFAGAGNLTGSAFRKNFENFYFVEIPSVVEAFKAQYSKMWNRMATSAQKMPVDYELP